MTAEDLKVLEEIQLAKMRDITENEMYFEGKNPGIRRAPMKATPDNRITIPLAKSSVEDLSGFAAKTGNIKFDWGNNETYRELNKKIYKHNDTDLLTSELYTQNLVQGNTFELFWVSESEIKGLYFMPEYALIENHEIVLEWSKDLKPRLLSATRFVISGDYKYADVYYPEISEGWKRKIEKDPFPGLGIGEEKSKWVRNPEADKMYPYTQVPISYYRGNRKCQSLFQAEKGIMDLLDSLISKSANEIDRFNALVALFPGKITPEFIKKLEDSKAIDDLDKYDEWPRFLEKSLNGINEFYNSLADRIERLFHKTIKVPDFANSEVFNDASGIAIEYKLSGLEFRAAQIDTYFDKGLKKRQELIDEVLALSNVEKDKDEEFKIKHIRNLPVDVTSKIENAQKLQGIVSRETILGFLPEEIVADVEEELEKLMDEFGKIDFNEGDENDTESSPSSGV